MAAPRTTSSAELIVFVKKQSQLTVPHGMENERGAVPDETEGLLRGADPHVEKPRRRRAIVVGLLLALTAVAALLGVVVKKNASHLSEAVTTDLSFEPRSKNGVSGETLMMVRQIVFTALTHHH